MSKLPWFSEAVAPKCSDSTKMDYWRIYANIYIIFVYMYTCKNVNKYTYVNMKLNISVSK